jgi:type IV pilus assembly protein PilB
MDLNTADEEARRSRKPIHQVLVDMGLADKMTVLQALAAEWNVKPISLDEITIQPDVAKLLPAAVARKNFMLPIIKEDGMLLVVMADPGSPPLGGSAR